MYVTDVEELQALGSLELSLKPPKWLRDLGAKVLHGTTATVPTPAGPIIVDLGDPDSLKRVMAELAQTKVTIGRRAAAPPSPIDRVTGVVESIPGGWGTIALIGGGLLALPFILKAIRGRR